MIIKVKRDSKVAVIRRFREIVPQCKFYLGFGADAIYWASNYNSVTTRWCNECGEIPYRRFWLPIRDILLHIVEDHRVYGCIAFSECQGEYLTLLNIIDKCKVLRLALLHKASLELWILAYHSGIAATMISSNYIIGLVILKNNKLSSIVFLKYWFC